MWTRTHYFLEPLPSESVQLFRWHIARRIKHLPGYRPTADKHLFDARFLKQV